MYKIVVEDISTGRRSLAVEECRISALASADYCLGRRRETGRGRFCWTGTRENIRRLFEAERLDNTFLDTMEDGQEYGVMFFCCLRACA